MQKQEKPNILKKNILSPGYSYELFPTVKELLRIPHVPSEKELEKMEKTSPEELNSTRNLRKLVNWSRGLQKEITKLVESEKTPQERGGIIRDLAERYERVQTGIVLTYLADNGLEARSGRVKLESGKEYPFPGVTSTDGRTLFVEPGMRTMEEHARLHGKALANMFIREAFEGKDDIIRIWKSMRRSSRDKPE